MRKRGVPSEDEAGGLSRLGFSLRPARVTQAGTRLSADAPDGAAGGLCGDPVDCRYRFGRRGPLQGGCCPWPALLPGVLCERCVSLLRTAGKPRGEIAFVENAGLRFSPWGA